MKAVRVLAALAMLVSVVTVESIQAQPPGGGMGGGMGMGGGRPGGMEGGEGGMQQQRQKRDPIESMGLFLFDNEELLRECKIKDDKVKGDVVKVMAEYVKTYDSITVEFSSQIDSLKKMRAQGPPQRGGQAQQGEGQEANAEGSARPNRESMRSLMLTMRTIRERTIAMHKSLNESMAATLSEKEKKRWDSYYADVCYLKSFSTEERGPRGGQGGEGGQGGQGGMGRPMGGGM